MTKYTLPPARYLLLRSKSMIAPLIFLVVASVISVESYRFATDVDGSALPLLAFNITLVVLIVFTYVFQQLRSEYWVVRDFFEGERTGYVRRAADALRTPLTGVRWLSEMMMEGEMGALNQEQKDGLEKINAATKRVLVQTDELLKVVKICGGLIQYRPVVASLADTVRTAAQSIEPFAQSKDQTVAIASSVNETTFRFDQKLILHVLEVLLMNAVQLAPQKGTIALGVRTDRGMMLVDITSSPVATDRQHPPRRIGTAPGLDKAQREEYSDEVNMAVSYEIINAATGELWVAQTDKSIVYTVALPLEFISSPLV